MTSEAGAAGMDRSGLGIASALTPRASRRHLPGWPTERVNPVCTLPRFAVARYRV